MARPKDRSRWAYWAYEFGVKQPIDQSLHATMMMIATRAMFVGDRWAMAAGVVITVLIVMREWKQWPSSRVWDAPMDFTGYGIGAGIGIWLGLK